MAESNQRKIADPIDIDDDDPFAELTRIMGFDPRASALSQSRELVGANSAKPGLVTPKATHADDDFGIDLEKELLGGFDDFDLPHEPVHEPAAADATAPAVAAAVEHADDQLSDDLAAAIELDPMESELAVAAHSAVGDDVFEQAVAGDIEDAAPTAVEGDPMEAELTAAAQSLVGDDPFEQAITGDIEDTAPVAAAALPVGAGDSLDDDLAAELDLHFAEVEQKAAASSVDAIDWRVIPHAVADEPEAAAPAGAREAIASSSQDAALALDDEDLMPEFDLGDLDLHHGSDEVEPAEVALLREGHVAAAPVERPAADETAGHEIEAAAEDDDLMPEFDLGDLGFHHDSDEVEPAEVAALHEGKVSSAPVEARSSDEGAGHEIAAAAEDHDLMPEFDLGDLDLHHDSDDVEAAEAALPREEQVTARQAETHPAAKKVEVVAPGDGFADVDMDFSAAFEHELDDGDNDRSVPEQAAAAPGRPIAADDHLELSLEDEISALLEEHQVQSPPAPPVAVAAVAVAPVVAPAVAAAPQRGPSKFLSDPRWAALEADEEGEPVDRSSQFSRTVASAARAGAAAAEQRRPFGDLSLTSRHANFTLPQTSAQPPVEDLDDLLASMETEAHAADLAPRPAAKAEQPTYLAPRPVTKVEPPAYQASAPAPAAPAHDEHEVAPQVASRKDAAPAETAHAAVPDIETIDVPEAAVALADDLDLPELAYEEDEPQPAAYDDIDADFAATFNQIATNEEPVNHAVRGTTRPAERANLDADYEALYRPAYAQPRQPQPVAEIDFEPLAADDEQDRQPQDYDDYAPSSQAVSAGDRFVDLDFDGDADEETVPSMAAYREPQRSRQGRGLLIAAIVGGVALLGGASVLAMSYVGGPKSSAPVLVKADDSPVKVKPENPGGTAVPNQDNKVYDAVKGATAQATPPAQKKLVTTAEEPLDMAAVDKADALPGGNVDKAGALPGANVGKADALPGVNDEQPIVAKAEDRVDPVADADQDPPAEDNVAVAPRRVKTMVVRSDGTLVPREEPAASAPVETSPAVAAADQAAATAAPSTNDETGAVASTTDDGPALQSPGGDVVPVKPVKSTKVNGEGKTPADSLPPKAVKSTKVDADGKPQAAAAAPALAPANIGDDDAAAQPAAPAADPQPVAEKPAVAKPAAAKPAVKPEEVASANVEPTAIASGTWSVQIASQPSEEAAKSNYQDLAKRFGAVIGGRGVNIVKAEIDGKGTYWRVRVPAKSRNDAISLCTDYKAAGGNCFVSK